MTSVESRLAIVQLRALLSADAEIDSDRARRLVDVAAGNMHDVKDPKAEALAILDLIEADSRQRKKRGWFSPGFKAGTSPAVSGLRQDEAYRSCGPCSGMRLLRRPGIEAGFPALPPIPHQTV